MKRSSGVTLIELLITSAIVGIGILAMIGSYRYISTSIQVSKGKTLANNLVTEQVEKLKNLQYYSLLVTTSTYSDSRFTPPLLYDTGSYPAQSILQGGITFIRGTRVDFVYQSGTTITPAPWTSDDTGLKMITVYVMWQDNFGLRYQSVQNLMANPAANPLNATFTGTVKDNLGNNIVGATVKTIDNPNYYGITNNSGVYQFSVSSGNYTLDGSLQGYFSADRNAKAQTGSPTTVNFTLNQMSSGTASGYAYLDNHLVISQVVAATGTVAGGGGGNQDVEYIELYNPTTSSILIGSNGSASSPNIVPVLWDSSNNGYMHTLYYVNTNIPANGFYLISNTGAPSGTSTSCSTFTVLGVPISPDACWKFFQAPNHIFECGAQPCSGPSSPDAGGISIANSNAYTTIPGFVNMSNWPAASIDSLAWSKNASGHFCPSNATEGTCMSTSNALWIGEQFARITASGGTPGTGVGRAYDSNNNTADFYDSNPMTSYRPYTSSNIYAPISGTPAAGAYVTSNDPLSSTAQCDSTGHFSVPNIATGTWTIAIATNSYYLEVSTVQMTPSLSTGVPNGSTSPTFPAGTALNNSLLSNTTTMAFFSGLVTDTNNNPLSNIQVNAGGITVNTNSSGRYFVATATGDVLIVANNGNQNKGYASQSNIIYGSVSGVVYDNPTGASYTWFTLPLAGTLVGYFQTSSLTALPGQTLVALSGGNQVAQAVSDNTGHAYLTNLSTGTYTLSPQVDPASSVSPTGPVVTLSSTGTATSYSTFTVTNGLAEITGQVSIAASTAPITTGVLVMASTATLAGGSTTPPPTLNGGLGTLCAPCYYGASSDATGEYTLYVRSSTTPYQLYGWYTATPGFPTSRQGPYSVTVSTAGMIMSKNMSW